MKTYRPPHPTTPHERQKASKTMKRYTIATFTKANRTEYFHAVTVEAENIKSAKEAAAEHIRATLDRHAFRMSNATAPASVEYAQLLADHFNVTVEDVMKAAAEPEGVDIHADEFKPAPVEAENPINSGNAPLYVWTFANGAESAATLTAEASSAADATEYARAARICANEAAEAAEIAGTAEAAKDAERARIAADNAEAIRAYWDAHEEAKAAESAEAATSAAALDYDHITAAEHAAEAEKHADAAEKAAHEAAAIADEAHDPEVSSTAEMAAEEAYRARQFANDARETAEKTAEDLIKAYAEAIGEPTPAYMAKSARLVSLAQEAGGEKPAPVHYDTVRLMQRVVANHKSDPDALRELFEDLKSGAVYGHQVNNVTYPFFWENLGIHDGWIKWNHYGASANRVTMHNLAFVVFTIFKTTPRAFMQEYERRA